MIGIIDSGSGGVNVINECKKFYNEDFLYLVDNKNCPYGNKPKEIVSALMLNNINYLVSKYDLDFIIIACNTASAILSYKDLENIKIPILKTTPDMQSLTKINGAKILFATKNTIKNSLLVKYYLLNYKAIKTMHIKGLPKYIDAKITAKNSQNNEKIKKLLKKSLIFNKKLKNSCRCMSLGCTHFKHIKDEIKNIFNNDIVFFECEKKVASLSKFFVRKQKNMSSIKLILTQQDDKLEKTILDMIE